MRSTSYFILGFITLQLSAFFACCHGHSAGTVQFPSDSPKVLEASNFALRKLREVSESGIFDTLTVERISDAYGRSGKYHNILEFSWILSSPHLSSDTKQSHHKVVVLTPFGDPNKRHFTIDEFPSMMQTSVEQFMEKTRKKVQESRNKFFKDVEAQYIDSQAKLLEHVDVAPTLRESEVSAYSTRVLRAILPKLDPSSAIYATVNKVIDDRLDALEQSEKGNDLKDEL